MKNEKILLITVALVVGLLCGVIITNANKKIPGGNQAAPPTSSIDSLQHLNSLYNLGIVYSQDLGEKQKADEAWNRFLELNPTGQAADKVRTMLDHMWNGHG